MNMRFTRSAEMLEVLLENQNLLGGQPFRHAGFRPAAVEFLDLGQQLQEFVKTTDRRLMVVFVNVFILSVPADSRVTRV
ncbi:MAG: hypothetical protein HC794_07335 [Nitrospiraceae bacterium]|nr:hypothetical protein [Nitrospiraceae bacterium]